MKEMLPAGTTRADSRVFATEPQPQIFLTAENAKNAEILRRR